AKTTGRGAPARLAELVPASSGNSANERRVRLRNPNVGEGAPKIRAEDFFDRARFVAALEQRIGDQFDLSLSVQVGNVNPSILAWRGNARRLPLLDVLLHLFEAVLPETQ